MKSLFLLFIFAFFPFLSFGRCPQIEGEYSPGGKGNPYAFLRVKKINCSTFSIVRGLGDSTFTITLGAPEKCEDFVYMNICYREKYQNANEVVFFFKEVFATGGCIREMNYVFNEDKKSLEISQNENCKRTGIKSLPKINFQKVKE